MAFFKKRKAAEPAGEDVRGAAPAEQEDRKSARNAAAADKQRLKKIRNMKKKFDETVWNNCVDIMRKNIPQFTLVERSEEDPEVEITKYVLLGFDTKIVDDFSNKADDDVGSILTAIKSSMDCIIEDGLFENELILVIPTNKSLAALEEFEDTFDLKFYVAYVTEEHNIQLETKTQDPNSGYIYITLPDVRDMLANNVYIKDEIRALQHGTTGILGNGKAPRSDSRAASAGGGDEAVPEDEFEDIYGDSAAEDRGSVPDEGEPPVDDEEPVPDDEEPEETEAEAAAETARQAVGKAVKDAGRAAERVAEQAQEVPKQGVLPEEAAKAAAPQISAGPEPQPAPVSAVQARIERLTNAAQNASDAARKDADVQRGGAAMSPAAAPQFDMQAMDQYITRKYYSDDLQLEISSEPFDAMFVQSNPYAPFEVQENDGWLNGYVNNLRRDANTRLAKLHYENLLLMRKRYLLIIADHCKEITKSVSTDDPKSRFGYTLQTIKEMRDRDLESVKQQAEVYRRECEESYQSRLTSEMENASNVAKANFINRYQKDHDREMRDIEADLRNNIESEYVAAVENLKNERRTEAKRQLDAGISEALRICADEYNKMLAQERKEFSRIEKAIMDYMNENMALDDARVRVLAEEHRRSNESVKVREEYDAQLALAKQDFEARLASMQSEIEENTVAHENFSAAQQDRYEHSMQQLRSANAEAIQHKDNEIHLLEEQLAKANARADELTQKYSSLEQDTEKKYVTQIDMLKSEREAWSERADHLVGLHKYTDRLKLTGMIVAVVAALCLGIIAGCLVMTQRNQKADAQAAQAEPEIHYFIDGKEVGEEDLPPNIHIETENGQQ